MSTLSQSNNANATLCNLRDFIGKPQRVCLHAALEGEEAEYFQELIEQLRQRIEAMPQTYQTETQEEDEGTAPALAHLHYFKGGCDWYIIEKDINTDGAGQVQVYGIANLGYGPELGYISLPELLACGAELDLHWTPKPNNEILEA